MAAARIMESAVKLTGEDVVLNIVSGVAGLGAAFCYNGSAPLVGAKSILLEIWSPKRLSANREENATSWSLCRTDCPDHKRSRSEQG